MDLINFLIEVTTLASAAYLGVMFIAGIGRRPHHAAVVEQSTEQELFDALSDFGADVAAGLMSEQEAVEAVYGSIDCVVPFRRPVRPARPTPTDRQLIELAKSCDYPGSKKWSYGRKLSQQVRAVLLETWEVIESHKAA